MRIGASPLLDALCGEYLLGTLRGSARRRFERALREDPRVGARLRYWETTFLPRYSVMIEAQPSENVWKRLSRELGLARYRTPWHRRLGFWRGFAAAVTVALAIAIGVQVMHPAPHAPTEIARLEGKTEDARVVALLSHDGKEFGLRAARPVVAGPNQSYELWLLPAEGGPPLSMAVLGSLDAHFVLPPAIAARIKGGGKLAVSVEPAGGSPAGAPTGPVILAGSITL